MEGRTSRAGRLLAVLLPPLVLAAVPETSAPDPAGDLRAARTAWEAGEPRAALQALHPLEGGPLEDHAAFLRATWLHEMQDLDGALAAASEALAHDPPSEVRSLVHQELAAIYLERDDLAEAYRAREAAWTSTRSQQTAARLAYEFAQTFESRGLPGDARRLYQKIWQTWPRSESSAGAFERSRFLSEATGTAPAEPKALLRYADGLRTAYLCDGALDIYDQVLTSDPDPKTSRRAARGRADCLFQRRRYAEAEVAYRELAREDPSDVDAAIRAARSQARGGKSDEAVQSLTAIAKRTERTHRARAQYLIAIILRDEDPESADRLLRRVEKQRHANGLSRAARWRLAWSELQSGQYPAAIKRLRPLKRGPMADIEVQRARYWSAVAELQVDPETGREKLLGLVDKVPLSYYGMLSADRLGLNPDVEHSFIGDSSTPGPFLPEQRATWLLDGGLHDQARAEVESWVRTGRLKRAQRVAAAALLHRLGDHFSAVRLLINGFGGALEQGIDPEWRAAWQYAWPQPFSPAVDAAAEEFEFDPALVYAVMREESTYRPRVESPAGALGLMQIIPPTGNRIANTLGVEPFAPALLLDPSTNIRFGTYYLKYLTRLFDGSRSLAIAAYNAGPEAVTGWINRDGPLPDDAFVDSVPYSETRRYLRKVIRSWRVYRLLYRQGAEGADAGSQPVVTPIR